MIMIEIKNIKINFREKMAKKNENRRKDLPKFLKSEIAKKKKTLQFLKLKIRI